MSCDKLFVLENGELIAAENFMNLWNQIQYFEPLLEREWIMIRCKIIGAGSIGNHLAHASRVMGWEVVVCDSSKESLSHA